MRTYESWTADDVTELEEALDWTELSDWRYRTKRDNAGDDTLFGSLAEEEDLPPHLHI
ncbi:MAG TPA: hypothetical protein VGM06_10700 [Polyangiaceae bacterium]|jgi:hypothetical protein